MNDAITDLIHFHELTKKKSGMGGKLSEGTSETHEKRTDQREAEVGENSPVNLVIHCDPHLGQEMMSKSKFKMEAASRLVESWRPKEQWKC